MASVKFNIAKKMLFDGTLDMDTDVIKAVLVQTTTTADIDIDADTVSAITTLAEFDGSGFTWGHGNTGRKTLTLSAAVNDTDDRGELNEASGFVEWATLGAGSNPAQGILIIRQGTASDADAIPIQFMEFAAPYTASGVTLRVNFDASDVMRMT